MTRKRIHKIYSILLAIALAVSGICLIAGCISIYYLGNRPFTPETVATAFAGIRWAIYPCLVLILGGFILDIFFPAPAKKNRIGKAAKKTAKESKITAGTLMKLRWAVLAVAVVCLLYGFIAGGTEDVLTKAVNICTECVGLG